MKSREGFTLIELTVVMGVMALLMALAVPKYIGYRQDVKVLEMQQDCKVIKDIVTKYRFKNPDAQIPNKSHSHGHMHATKLNQMTGVPIASELAKLTDTTPMGNLGENLNNNITDYVLLGTEERRAGTSYMSDDEEIFIVHDTGIEDSSGVLQFTTETYQP